MTARPGLPGFPEVATACQVGQLSHTILYPSNERADYSRYCKSSNGIRSLVCRVLRGVLIMQWFSIIVVIIWFLSGVAQLAIKQRGFFLQSDRGFSSPATSFAFTHLQPFFKEGLVQFACVEVMLIFVSLWHMSQWSLIAKRSGLTMNACGHGYSICWTHCRVDVCQSYCWMPAVGQVLSVVMPWVWCSHKDRTSMVHSCMVFYYITIYLLLTPVSLPETPILDASSGTVASITSACRRRCGQEFVSAPSYMRPETGCKLFPARENAITGPYWCASNMSLRMQQVQMAPSGIKCVWLKEFCKGKTGSGFWQLLKLSAREVRSGKRWSLAHQGHFGTSSMALFLKLVSFSTAGLQQEDNNRETQRRLLRSYAKHERNWQPCQSESYHRDNTHIKTSAICLSAGTQLPNTGGGRESWMCWLREIGCIVRLACWMNMTMLGIVETWLKCGPRRDSCLERLWVPRKDAIANLCGSGRTMCSGRLTSSSLVQKVGAEPSQSTGSNSKAMRTRVTWWSPTHLQFVLMQLLIFSLCVMRCIDCAYEKQCQNGLVRQSCGDSCCIRNTCEPSCDVEWVFKQIHRGLVSYNAWWGSCGPFEGMDARLQSGTGLPQLKSISATVRVGLQALDSSTCWILWAEPFTTTSGRLASMLLKETMLPDTPGTGVGWNLSYSNTAWAGACEKRRFRTALPFMMLPMPSTPSTTLSLIVASQGSPRRTMSACWCSATDRRLSVYMEETSLQTFGWGPERFKVMEWQRNFLWRSIIHVLTECGNMPPTWSHQDSLSRGMWSTTSGWRLLFPRMQMMLRTKSLATLQRRSQTKAPNSMTPSINVFQGLDWLRTGESKNMSPSLLGQEPELSTLQCFATIYWQGRLSVQLGILDHVMTCVAACTRSCSIEWGLRGWGGSCLAGSGLELLLLPGNPDSLSSVAWCTRRCSLAWNASCCIKATMSGLTGPCSSMVASSCVELVASNVGAKMVKCTIRPSQTSRCTNTCTSHLAGMNCRSKDCSGISRLLGAPNCTVFGLHACLGCLASNTIPPLNMTAASTEMPTHGHSSFKMPFWSSCCVSKMEQSWFPFSKIGLCGFLQTFKSCSSRLMCPQFVSSILQFASLHLNMLLAQRFQQPKTVGWQSWMSLLSDAHAYVKMAHRARPLSRANSNSRFTFALRKGVRTQSFQITESWQSRINARFAGMCSAASALRNNTLGEPCAIRYALEVVALWCLSQTFPATLFAHTAQLLLHRCHSCGIMWSNMWLGPGAKSSCSEPRSLKPSCFTMDAWELGPPAAKPTAKRVAVGTEKDMAKAVHLIARLCLKNSLEVRELQAACFVTFILPKSCPYVQAVLNATKQYADKAKSAQAGKCEPPPGEPHVHAWAALLRVALDDEALNADDRQAIEQHRAVSTDPLIMSGVVYVCKVRKAFDRDSMKMFFSVHRDAEPSLAALTKGVIHAGGKLKRGQAPKSGLEREVQEVVDHLTEILGSK